MRIMIFILLLILLVIDVNFMKENYNIYNGTDTYIGKLIDIKTEVKYHKPNIYDDRWKYTREYAFVKLNTGRVVKVETKTISGNNIKIGSTYEWKLSQRIIGHNHTTEYIYFIMSIFTMIILIILMIMILTIGKYEN